MKIDEKLCIYRYTLIYSIEKYISVYQMYFGFRRLKRKLLKKVLAYFLIMY